MSTKKKKRVKRGHPVGILIGFDEETVVFWMIFSEGKELPVGRYGSVTPGVLTRRQLLRLVAPVGCLPEYALSSASRRSEGSTSEA